MFELYSILRIILLWADVSGEYKCHRLIRMSFLWIFPNLGENWLLASLQI